MTLDDYKQAVVDGSPLHYIVKENNGFGIYSHSIDCIKIRYGSKMDCWYIVDLPQRHIKERSFNNIFVNKGQAVAKLIEQIKEYHGIVDVE